MQAFRLFVLGSEGSAGSIAAGVCVRGSYLDAGCTAGITLSMINTIGHFTLDMVDLVGIAAGHVLVRHGFVLRKIYFAAVIFRRIYFYPAHPVYTPKKKG